MTRDGKAKSWLRRAALAVPTVLFAYAGAGKLTDPAAFAESISNYQLVPPLAAALLAVYLPWLELVLAFGLWPGRTHRAAKALSLLLLVGFTLALVVTAARGIDVRCGCFGGGAGQGPTAAWAALRNIVLIVFLRFGRNV